MAEDEIEESDLSDLEDWTDRHGGDGEKSPTEVENDEAESVDQEEVLLGKRKSRPHVEIEYETEEPRTKLKT